MLSAGSHAVLHSRLTLSIERKRSSSVRTILCISRASSCPEVGEREDVQYQKEP